MQKTTMLKGKMVTNDDKPLHFRVPHSFPQTRTSESCIYMCSRDLLWNILRRDERKQLEWQPGVTFRKDGSKGILENHPMDHSWLIVP
jgi:hypothetical protein